MRHILIYNRRVAFSFHAASMIVCVCQRVSHREIARHAAAGMDFSDIQRELGVATQCGRCEECARGIIEEACCRSGTAVKSSGRERLSAPPPLLSQGCA
jgi:bacterioferritin-associated ferredoxin